MIDLFWLVLPVFLIILLGKILRLTLLTSEEVWAGINRLTYWVLFPAFLFVQTSKIDLSNPDSITYSLSLIAGFFAALVFAYGAGFLTGSDKASLTSILQGAVRHNTFIGLAVAFQIFGAAGTAIGTVATAALVPLSNLVIVFLMMLLLHRGGGWRKLLGETMSNPVFLSILIGLIVAAYGLDQESLLIQAPALLGRATLPVMLLVVGANVHLAGINRYGLPTLVSTFAKMVLSPVVTFWVCHIVGLSPDLTAIAVLFAICPTSPASFPLAKQMGGEADLMATIISVQTALAVILIPYVLYLLGVVV